VEGDASGDMLVRGMRSTPATEQFQNNEITVEYFLKSIKSRFVELQKITSGKS
jgi:hypothetical protein